MEPQSSEGRPSPIAGIVMLAGGAVLIVGSLLAWVTVNLGRTLGGLSVDVKGTDADGTISLVCGIVVAIVGIVALAIKSRGVRRAMAIVAIVAGLIGGGVALYDISQKDNQLDTGFRQAIEQRTGQPATDAQLRALKAILERLGIKVSLGPGIYVTAIGGLVALAGGVMGVARPGGAVATPVATDGDAAAGPWAVPEGSPLTPPPVPPVPPESSPDVPTAPVPVMPAASGVAGAGDEGAPAEPDRGSGEEPTPPV
jgi:hypothetical protein